MPYHSYPRQGDRIAELLLMGGQQQAENAARIGETISSGLAGVGEQISGYYQAQGQRKREQAFSEFVRSGAWAQNPRIALAESLRFTSPAYLMELYMGARHFAQSADLYGPIEMKNPATPGVTATYLDAAREVADILASGDRDRFRAMFHEVQGFLGPFTGEALEQTSFLIDRLVERT